MKYTGPTYRPPYEANSLLLQVTVGCTHNKCTFCTMYKDTKFSIESLEQIEEDLKEARALYGDVKRVFLVNGDAFVLSANRLKPIVKLIIQYFPDVKVITMYASINNIKSKTDQELEELRDLRINDLWIGTETGHEETLEYMNKGFSLKDSYEQLERLNKAGIKHIDILIFGGAGRGKGMENAMANAKLVNASKPMGVSVTTMGTFGDSQVTKDVESGKFVPATELEVLEEQKKMIKLIDVDTIYLGIHGINTVTFDAMLPRDREKAIKMVDDAIEKLDDEFLNSVPERHSI
ncbi:HemN1 [Desulforapulum autotrophicum HRM2]|uniref:HemN1 n=1 Tax=Desulforapulum autotrophicum (strain ATCC 43914 / DSM 3382 / VKM B-1955 / HRM2) TaxID=177437 RepID=C0Q9P0_DESAH|nr:radical SAM protein [Desulforapulum autotrophicum]ACN14604.1 HemN1 [Desulforapulum autotrophicum HRM2]